MSKAERQRLLNYNKVRQFEFIFLDPSKQECPVILASTSRGSIFAISASPSNLVSHKKIFQDQEERLIQDILVDQSCTDGERMLGTVVASIGDGIIMIGLLSTTEG
mmetsp:Transcript_13411/g.22838  ORF Transcript_13411/g.22838 Transcript_13411/m.22838 type:complete len:106 (+) Transcript_13411:204-521(+)